MAHYNEQTKNMSNHSDRFKYMKKIIQILLPLSVFSLFFSQSSLTPLFLQSYDYLVSDFSFKFKLFTYTTERNCIFLLCNGILVFIIQSSGLISKITPVDSGPKTARTDDHRAEKDGKSATVEESNKKGAAKVEILEEKIHFVAEEVEEDLQNFEVEKWDEHDDDDDDDDDEEEDGGIDTDELKKKCEDFIKKVKMEIQGA